MERLKELRKEKNISQYELALITGISQTAYSGYESGKVMPTIEPLIKLADYYHVTLDYLVGRNFANDAGYLTAEEKELLKVFRNLNNRNKQTLIDESKGILLAQTL